MFLQLKEKTLIEVAYEFGLDRFLASASGMKTYVSKAYNLVLQNPVKYGVMEKEAGLIQGIVSARSLKFGHTTLKEKEEAQKFNLGDFVQGTRDLSIKLLRKRLEYLERHPKEAATEKLRDLAWVAGLLFDKGQIIMGQATEHVAVMSRIDEKLTPEKALEAVLALRDEFQSQKAERRDE